MTLPYLQKRGRAKTISSSSPGASSASSSGPQSLEEHTRNQGLAYAFAAYAFWGVAPLYFLLVEFAPPTEIIVHRIFWSVLFLLAILAYRGDLKEIARMPLKHYGALAVTGALLAFNWWVFVWALQNDRVMETSVGYYINPLVSVVLGVVVLGERLRRWQWVAVAIVSLGMLNEVVTAGRVPLVALALVLTFGFYGLARKSLGIDAVRGLTIEAILMLPLGMLGFGWLLTSGTMSLPELGVTELFYLALGGIVTTLPLLWFNAAAVRLPLVVLGLVQYLAPSITLLLAVFVYGEPFTVGKAITFSLVWLGLLVFSLEGVQFWRGQKRLAMV